MKVKEQAINKLANLLAKQRAGPALKGLLTVRGGAEVHFNPGF